MNNTHEVHHLQAYGGITKFVNARQNLTQEELIKEIHAEGMNINFSNILRELKQDDANSDLVNNLAKVGFEIDLERWKDVNEETHDLLISRSMKFCEVLVKNNDLDQYTPFINELTEGEFNVLLNVGFFTNKELIQTIINENDLATPGYLIGIFNTPAYNLTPTDIKELVVASSVSYI